MSGTRVQIAVVGLGRMGRRHVHSLLYRVPYAHVVAVCTNEPHEIEWAESNAEYSDFGIKVYKDFSEMLDHQGLQAVWVSSSTDVHSPQTLQAIQKGMHVLCEKPLSTDIEEAQTVINAAKQHPELKVMAGFSRRFDSSYRDAAQKIHQDQAIGKPFLVRSQTCDLLDTTGFFVKYASRNGAIFVDCAIHDIDLALWYLDNPVPKACWATGSIQHHPELAASRDVDNAVGVLEFWDGRMAYFHCSRTQAHGHDVCTEITGTEGKIAVNVVPRANNVVLADGRGMSHAVQPEYWQRFEDAFATEANEFIAAIRNDTEVPLPLETGQKVMLIARALQDAMWSGELSRFDESGQRV